MLMRAIVVSFLTQKTRLFFFVQVVGGFNCNKPRLMPGAFAPDLPRDLLQIVKAGQSPVFVVRALQDLERNANRINQAGAENNAFALRIALNDPGIHTGVAARLRTYGRATINFA
jgi:hypothetical protein